MARAMASAKSMKKASWVVDMGRGNRSTIFPASLHLPTIIFQGYIYQDWVDVYSYGKKRWFGKGHSILRVPGSTFRPCKLVLYRPPQKKNSSSHLLDVGVSENGFILAYCHIFSFFTRCIYFIDFQIYVLYSHIYYIHIYTHCLWVYSEDWWSVDLFKWYIIATCWVIVPDRTFDLFEFMGRFFAQ